MDLAQALTLLASTYSAAKGVKISTVGYQLANHGAFFDRLTEGGGVTNTRYSKIVQNFSDHWPADLPWPENIARPAPQLITDAA